MTIELDDYDRSILQLCPITIVNQKSSRLTRIEAERMKRIKRLWSAGFVRGTVENEGRTLFVTIRDPGRIAIGRPAIETPAAESTDAPAS